MFPGTSSFSGRIKKTLKSVVLGLKSMIIKDSQILKYFDDYGSFDYFFKLIATTVSTKLFLDK